MELDLNKTNGTSPPVGAQWETEFKTYADELNKRERQARAREEQLPVIDDDGDDPPASQWDDLSTGCGATRRADWVAANAPENDMIDYLDGRRHRPAYKETPWRDNADPLGHLEYKLLVRALGHVNAMFFIWYWTHHAQRGPRTGKPATGYQRLKFGRLKLKLRNFLSPQKLVLGDDNDLLVIREENLNLVTSGIQLSA
jgi:hypothetical protein